MPETRPSGGRDVLVWGPDLIEENTIQQAMMTARLPILAGPVALMPDAHVGKGSTVGSVIPTRGAIIPAAVGVDIGCGMIAAETTLTSNAFPDDLTPLLNEIGRRIPAGVGQGHDASARGDRWLVANPPPSVLSAKQEARARSQYGSLGSGNHFVEVCLDERDHVWLVLHSGSRGIGNQLAQAHIATAQQLAETFLEDRDLAWFTEGTPEFDSYIDDLLWAQRYAAGNRQAMMDSLITALGVALGSDAWRVVLKINCHHNYTARETIYNDSPGGEQAWVTRKGAIRAGIGDRGVIPGSMGASTFIVHGLGNAMSYDSCSHGAGRKLSRGRAKRELSWDTEPMDRITWQSHQARALLDEHPGAYKNVDAVMAAQGDLVAIDHVLHQVLNYKGV